MNEHVDQELRLDKNQGAGLGHATPEIDIFRQGGGRPVSADINECVAIEDDPGVHDADGFVSTQIPCELFPRRQIVGDAPDAPACVVNIIAETRTYPYVGVLYVGLMIDPAGTPRVVEFNVRFGDPETQPLVVRMAGDLVPLLDGAARGCLERAAPLDWSDAAVCVVLASGGYPREFEKGKPIEGLEALETDTSVVVFHAGTKRSESGGFVTAGGRVLGVTARGATVAEARDRAYAAADRIRFDAMHLRRDIAGRAAAS